MGPIFRQRNHGGLSKFFVKCLHTIFVGYYEAKITNKTAKEIEIKKT